MSMSLVCFVKCDTNVKLTAPSKNADHPNKCWDEATKTAYSVGSHNPKESCQRIHCYPDFRIKYTSCGTHSAGQGYSIEQDLTKVYPECCAKLVKVEKKAKRVDVMASSEVRINRFRSRGKSVEAPKEKKPLEQTKSSELAKPLVEEAKPSVEESKPLKEIKTVEEQQPKEESTE